MDKDRAEAITERVKTEAEVHLSQVRLNDALARESEARTRNIEAHTEQLDNDMNMKGTDHAG